MNNEIIVKVDTGELLTAIQHLIEILTKATSAAVPAPVLPPAVPVQPPAPTYALDGKRLVPVESPTVPMQPVQPPPVAAVPTSAPVYTIEQISVAATPLIDAGRRLELVNLLAAFGVDAVVKLPKERYGEFATALRQLGAKI